MRGEAGSFWRDALTFGHSHRKSDEAGHALFQNAETPFERTHPRFHTGKPGFQCRQPRLHSGKSLLHAGKAPLQIANIGGQREQPRADQFKRDGLFPFSQG